MADNSELEDLKREVEALKKQVTPAPPIDWKKLEAEHRDWLHQLRERQAANWYQPSREELAAYQRATPDDCCRDLASHGTVQRPSASGVSGTLTATHSSPGLPGSHRGTGWVESKPLGPVPGLQHIDAIGEAFAARDRAEAIEQEAKRLRIEAALKKAASE
jgi:hypothetical protein